MVTYFLFMYLQDSLLASIAETEMQTELMERVSTWKQRIEHTLDEQVSNNSFMTILDNEVDVIFYAG